MIIIHDEEIRVSIDAKTLQKRITSRIEKYREDINSEQYPSQMPNLTETFDTIAECQDQLRDVTELLKVPFDILIVLQREK